MHLVTGWSHARASSLASFPNHKLDECGNEASLHFGEAWKRVLFLVLFDVWALLLHGIMPVQRTEEDIIKSAQDERQYRSGNELRMGMGMDVFGDL